MKSGTTQTDETEETEQAEGVIKFQLDFEKSDTAISSDILKNLNHWRSKLFALKLIGQDDNLYNGYSYGNLSARTRPGSEEFVISGSQTSHLPTLSNSHYALVVKTDIDQNRLVARGKTKPSSEALTHSAFYAANKNINVVFHVHSAAIWQNTRTLDIPMTSPAIAYGTPEMAREIQLLFINKKLFSRNVVAMGGHQDGVISFGATADEAGKSLLKALSITG